jgi:peptide/nickel transport system permease protein
MKWNASWMSTFQGEVAMRLRSAASFLLLRLLIFALAGIAVTLLLHTGNGVIPHNDGRETPSFSAQRWLESGVSYFRKASQGDLGTLPRLEVPPYVAPQPVTKVLKEHGPRTAYLFAVALLLTLGLGTLVGFMASRVGAGWLRATIWSGMMILVSIPDILLILLIRQAVMWTFSTFGIKTLRVLVTGGWQPLDVVAPAIVLAALPLAQVARIAMVAFDETYGELYVRTAVAKGLSPIRVMWSHVLKNAWGRIISGIPGMIGTLTTGLVVTEYVFYYPGLGRVLGLILENVSLHKKGLSQTPFDLPSEATTSIVLSLLIGAAILDFCLGIARTLLDPRLGEVSSAQAAGGGFVWRGGRFRIPSVRAWLAGMVGWLRELPELLQRLAWAYRPGFLIREVLRSWQLSLGLFGFVLLLGVAMFGHYLADLGSASRAVQYLPIDGEVLFPPFKPGVPGFPLGSDRFGQDVLARLLVGARYTLFFTLAVTPVRFAVALPWGLYAGLKRGVLAAMSRMLGLIMSALPLVVVPVALMPLQKLLGSEDNSNLLFWFVIVILAVTGLPRLVEQIRLLVESTLAQPFVEGAVAAGATHGWILRRHVLPHLAPHLWVAWASDMVFTLVLLAQLGVFSVFLGGFATMQLSPTEVIIVPRIPNWSSMLSRPYEVIYQAPWALWYPAFAFLFAVFSVNLLSEGLRRRAQEPVKTSLPEMEVANDGRERLVKPARRRVAVEWLSLAMVVVGLGLAIAHTSTPAADESLSSDPLKRARANLQRVLETVTGTKDPLQRDKASGELNQVVFAYLKEAERAGLTETQMQEESRGRLQFIDVGSDYRLAYVVVPGVENGSHLFLHSVGSRVGHLEFYRSFAERPMSAVVLPGEGGPLFVLVGRLGGDGLWSTSFWGPDTRSVLSDVLVPQPDLVRALAERIPEGFGPKVVDSFTYAAVRLTGDRPSAAVLKNGDVEVCNSNRECTIIHVPDLIR